MRPSQALGTRFGGRDGIIAAGIITAVNMDGDSDSVGCIAGAISGAFNGTNAIPTEWRATIEQANYLMETALALLNCASTR